MGRRKEGVVHLRGGGARAVWLPGAVLIVIVGTLAMVVWATSRRGAAAVSAPAPAARFPEKVPDARQRLIGRWLRPDGGYVLSIQNISEAGNVLAAYANPRPVNVAAANAQNLDGELSLYVELRDRGYPGNFYTLNYDQSRDELTGTYRHVGIGEDFDVRFVRVP